MIIYLINSNQIKIYFFLFFLKVLKELTVLLRQLKSEKDVHVVLITSGGPEFCTGIDISTLMNDSIPARKECARNISNIIQ